MEPYLSDYNDLKINQRSNHTNNEDNNILDDDNIEKILTNFFDADIPLDDDDDVGNNWCSINDDEFLSGLFNKFPTKNSGELSYIVDEETQYCGNFGIIELS